jgi:hypothetical protein
MENIFNNKPKYFYDLLSAITMKKENEANEEIGETVLNATSFPAVADSACKHI